MVTLIAAYNSQGCIGRCDAKCYEASTPDCTCICGGTNHGAGVNKATENTKALAEKWIEEYQKRTGESLEFEVLPKPVQLEMF